jgi:DNA-directed RNA polymerase specialized sigma24 family protein
MQPFDRVVTEHGAVVLRVCRAVLGGHADAEDAWSETFLSALVAYPRLGPRADVRAWLDLGVPGAADPDLWAAVARLPERQRLAVAYRYLGGLPYADVAAIVGGTAEAARRAAADGVASLRRVMAADPPGDDRVRASAGSSAAAPSDPASPASASAPGAAPAPAARGGRP